MTFADFFKERSERLCVNPDCEHYGIDHGHPWHVDEISDLFPRSLDLLEKMADWTINLQSEWAWKRNESRNGNAADYAELSDDYISLVALLAEVRERLGMEQPQ